MPTVNNATAIRTTNTSSNAVPTPQVSIVAYDEAKPELCSSHSLSTRVESTVNTVPLDPAYIEIDNYVPKAAIEMINKTKKPSSTFAQDSVRLVIDHVIVKPDGSRKAIAHLDADEMKASGMQPGDLVQLRQVTQAGKASKPSGMVLVDADISKLPQAEAVAQDIYTTSFDAGTSRTSSSRTIGRTNTSRTVRTTTRTTTDRQTDTFRFRAHTVRFAVETRNGFLPPADHQDVIDAAKGLHLGLRDNRTDLIGWASENLEWATEQYASQAKDESAPTVEWNRLSVKKEGGRYVLNADRALEPKTELIVVNIRTKEKTSVQVGEDTSASLKLPQGTLEGDDLAVFLAQDEDRAHTECTSTLALCRIENDEFKTLRWDSTQGDDAWPFLANLADPLDLPTDYLLVGNS